MPAVHDLLNSLVKQKINIYIYLKDGILKLIDLIIIDTPVEIKY